MEAASVAGKPCAREAITLDDDTEGSLCLFECVFSYQTSSPEERTCVESTGRKLLRALIRVAIEKDFNINNNSAFITSDNFINQTD